MEFGRWAEVMPSLVVSRESAVQKHNIVLELWLLPRVQILLIDKNVRRYQNLNHCLSNKSILLYQVCFCVYTYPYSTVYHD